LAVAQQINNARLQAEAIDAAPIAPHSAPEDDDA
jgi:hypothetical protein